MDKSETIERMIGYIQKALEGIPKQITAQEGSFTIYKANPAYTALQDAIFIGLLSRGVGDA